MKKYNLLKVIIVFFCLIPFINSIAQDLSTYQMIGKKLTKVIYKYGKPAHHDKSEPEMECVFYKTKNYQMVFVANRQGVYQVHGYKIFRKKSAANKALNKLLTNCNKGGMKTDTVNAAEYCLRGKNIEIKVTLFDNPHSKKYEVKVEAHKREG